MKNIFGKCSLLIKSGTLIIPLIFQTDGDEKLQNNHFTTSFVFVENSVSSFEGTTTVINI
jgi:hypothetical protein